MARAWLVDGRSIAKKVRNATLSSEEPLKDYGVKLECPYCCFHINNSDVELDWPGLPVGVKFDPTDVELVEHLAAKCGFGCSKPHPLIEEFIPTLQHEAGICYTHPEHLPGAKKDGTTIHFFHKTANAYATGHRKRRRVHSEGSSGEGGAVRWHKTGKTKPITDENGVHKGYKKIMVLHKNAKDGSKPEKSKWVVHQYHLGTDKDEDETQFVISKVFYQKLKENEPSNDSQTNEESNGVCLQPCPRTPNPNPPNPPRLFKSLPYDDNFIKAPLEAGLPLISKIEELKAEPEEFQLESAMECPPLSAGESQAVERQDFEIDNLLCTELPDTAFPGEPGNAHCNISELENLDYDLEAYFGSLESILNVLDRL